MRTKIACPAYCLILFLAYFTLFNSLASKTAAKADPAVSRLARCTASISHERHLVDGSNFIVKALVSCIPGGDQPCEVKNHWQIYNSAGGLVLGGIDEVEVFCGVTLTVTFPPVLRIWPSLPDGWYYIQYAVYSDPNSPGGYDGEWYQVFTHDGVKTVTEHK